MQLKFENDRDEMFFLLGKLTGFLADPAHVDALARALARALAHPFGGAQTRMRLLELHAILGQMLAVDPGALPTIQ